MDKTVYEVLSNRIPKPLQFAIRRENDKYLVKGIARSDIISLNELAGNILLKVNGKDNIESVINYIIDNYEDVKETSLKKDIFDILNDLERHQLISFN